MTNARELAKQWIVTKKLKNPNWGKITGIIQGLLKKYNSDEIESAMLKYLFYYPNNRIESFAGYCKRLILNERSKKKNV